MERTALEVGVANGRDARFFARDKKCVVTAVDFSENALSQLQEAALRDGTSTLIRPILSDMKHIPEFPVNYFDVLCQISNSSLR